MKKLTTPLTSGLAALLTLLAGQARAADPYFGLSLATPGEARLQAGPRQVDNDNHPLALKLYAGLQLSPSWSAEVGYGDFGSWHFSEPTSGSRDKSRIGTRALTAAARYRWEINNSLALFGKLGLAHNRLRYSDTLGQHASERFNRPLWGLGAEWTLTERLSVPLEFEYLGAAQTALGKFRQEKLEIGLRYRF